MQSKHRPVFAGLRPTPKDERDFKFGAAFALPDLAELPEEFVHPTKTYDQGNSDLCTAYMTCNMSALQEGLDLSVQFAFAAGKEISGDPAAWGQDLRTALKAHVKYGCLAYNEVQPTQRNLTDKQLRRFSVWPRKSLNAALKHRKQSYFTLEGQYDHFDNARAAIWKLRNEFAVIGFGVNWGYDHADIYLDDIKNGVGHAVTCIGWTVRNGKEYIVVQNSLGVNYGDGGRHYMTREVFNHFVEKYNAFLFTDLSPEEAKKRHQFSITDADGWFTRFIKYVKHYV